MAASINVLLRNRSLRLRLVTPDSRDPALDEPVSWVHSSDLQDPTPFLDAGQLLLTDGTQFPVESPQKASEEILTLPPIAEPMQQREQDYGRYIERLINHGIVALGFATQVVHGTLPKGLEVACRQQGLPLLEVPDRTPFIAIIRAVADYVAREENARSEWSLQAQRAISRAALRPDGLTSILGELERQLHSWVALYDAAGNYVRMPRNRPIPSDIAQAVTEQVRGALEVGARSAAHLNIAGQLVTMQTLGRKDHLRGALVFGAIEPFDPARADIVNSVVGLATLALEQARTLDTARRHLRSGVFEQILSGNADVAVRTSRQVWGELPRDGVSVIASRQENPAPNLLEALELLADDHRGAVFYAQHEDLLVVLTGRPHHDKVLDLLTRHDVVSGSSVASALPAVAHALEEASRAALRATEIGQNSMDFTELTEGGMFGLLRKDEAHLMSRGLLEPLLAHDAAERTHLLQTAQEWFANNCAWDSTARHLGIHRHTLRNRIDTAGRLTGLNLAIMRDRLEFFAALEFLDDRRPPTGH